MSEPGISVAVFGGCSPATCTAWPWTESSKGFSWVGLALLGVPLACPLAIVTFLGGFVPVVGALAAGALAAAVALVAVGPTTALAVIVLALVVQNVVTNLVDPLVMSRTVRIHPVVVLTAVISGGVLGGVLGAFVAVPVTATALEVAAFLREAD